MMKLQSTETIAPAHPLKTSSTLASYPHQNDLSFVQPLLGGFAGVTIGFVIGSYLGWC
jgi:hypothetical protein